MKVYNLIPQPLLLGGEGELRHPLVKVPFLLGEGYRVRLFYRRFINRILYRSLNQA